MAITVLIITIAVLDISLSSSAGSVICNWFCTESGGAVTVVSFCAVIFNGIIPISRRIDRKKPDLRMAYFFLAM
ncbi:MAG: hypothetical protein LPJ89_00240 [Hymenobacteraceae bacterium]|nr:hypothetical protein [Hymenobacteraceae bacterium]